LAEKKADKRSSSGNHVERNQSEQENNALSDTWHLVLPDSRNKRHGVGNGYELIALVVHSLIAPTIGGHSHFVPHTFAFMCHRSHQSLSRCSVKERAHSILALFPSRAMAAVRASITTLAVPSDALLTLHTGALS
jgi:hypothetical protein